MELNGPSAKAEQSSRSHSEPECITPELQLIIHPRGVGEARAFKSHGVSQIARSLLRRMRGEGSCKGETGGVSLKGRDGS